MKKNGVLSRPVDAATADEISSIRRLGDLEPMAPTMRMLAIDEELLALARGDREDVTLDDWNVLGERDPFDGLVPVFDDSASLAPSRADSLNVDVTAVPRVCMTDEELRMLSLDHRHGFVLCRIDGNRTVAEIASLTGLAEDRVCALVELLAALGVIELF